MTCWRATGCRKAAFDWRGISPICMACPHCASSRSRPADRSRQGSVAPWARTANRLNTGRKTLSAGLLPCPGNGRAIAEGSAARSAGYVDGNRTRRGRCAHAGRRPLPRQVCRRSHAVHGAEGCFHLASARRVRNSRPSGGSITRKPRGLSAGSGSPSGREDGYEPSLFSDGPCGCSGPSTITAAMGSTGGCSCSPTPPASRSPPGTGKRRPLPDRGDGANPPGITGARSRSFAITPGNASRCNAAAVRCSPPDRLRRSRTR